MTEEKNECDCINCQDGWTCCKDTPNPSPMEQKPKECRNCVGYDFCIGEKDFDNQICKGYKEVSK